MQRRLLNHFYNEELYYNNSDADGSEILTLRQTLLECRKQLLLSIDSLIDTEFAYSKVELREDYKYLQTQYKHLKDEAILSQATFQELIASCKCLVQQTDDVLLEREKYYSEWQQAKEILTPRPDWDKCADVMIDWKNLSRGKTSEQLVDGIIDEIVSEATNEDNSVRLTRALEEKFIPRRDMRRRITSLLIKEIWSTKLHAERAAMNFSDFVFEHLRRRFASEDLAIEMECNLKDACQRYRKTYQINLFWQILTGVMEENVYHHQMKEFARILQYLIERCSNVSSRSFEWTIPWTVFTQALHDLYPQWPTERLSLLIHSARRDLLHESNDVQFLLLFMEDDEGRVGEFLQTIREQLQLEKNDYIDRIQHMLSGHVLITARQFKRAVLVVDPLISKEELRRYVNWTFRSKKKEMCDFEEIILRFERCACFLHTPLPNEIPTTFID